MTCVHCDATLSGILLSSTMIYSDHPRCITNRCHGLLNRQRIRTHSAAGGWRWPAHCWGHPGHLLTVERDPHERCDAALPSDPVEDAVHAHQLAWDEERLAIRRDKRCRCAESVVVLEQRHLRCGGNACGDGRENTGVRWLPGSKCPAWALARHRAPYC